MFKKEKEMEKTSEVEKTREVGKPKETDTSSLAGRSSSAAKANRSVIGEQISIEGTIQGKGDLLVEGVVKGNIEVDSHHLTIDLKGNVESEIHAADVTISGKLKGNVHAKGKVAITKEAVFSGEINAKSISVEDGAYLKATIELSQEPCKETSLFESKPGPGPLGKSSPDTGKDTPAPIGKSGDGK